MAWLSENTDLYLRSLSVYILDVSVGKKPKHIRGKTNKQTLGHAYFKNLLKNIFFVKHPILVLFQQNCLCQQV